MQIQLFNASLRLTVDSLGAEMRSLLYRDEYEILWQGEAKYWADRAPNLFPYIARLYKGRYTYRGKCYEMGIHGFAWKSEFKAVRHSDTSAEFVLSSSAETLAQYPFPFVLHIHYALCDNRLSVRYVVENTGASVLPFAVGGHPGLNVGSGSADFERYRVRFTQPCRPMRVGFTDECFVDGTQTPFPLDEEGAFGLHHDLFDQDAIVLKDTAKYLILEGRSAPYGVGVGFPDMPYIGFWHQVKTDAPYICIEPWSSLPSDDGAVTDLETKEDLLRIPAGATYQTAWYLDLL